MTIQEYVKNGKGGRVLESFIYYCLTHPQERFWQALRNWHGSNFVLVAHDDDWHNAVDTFYFEGKRE